MTTLVEAMIEGAELSVAAGDGEPLAPSRQSLIEGASRTAQSLLARGLARGDRVMIMLPTGEAWLHAFFGTLMAGGVVVPVGPTFTFGGVSRHATTIRDVARSAGARFLIGNEHVTPHLETLRSASSLEHFLHPEELGRTRVLSHPLPSTSGGDLALLQYTSGTTASPKGVMLTHDALLTNARMIATRARMTTSDIGVSWLPLFHDMGLVGGLLTALVARYPLLMIPTEAFLMQPRRWLQWMSRRRATLSVAPNFAYQLAADRIADRHLEGLDLSAWRCAFSGAEPVRAATIRAFVDRFGRIGFRNEAMQPVYGMAENALAATFPRAADTWHAREVEGLASTREVVSVGTPLAGIRIAIRDGEITLRSPSMMKGYFGDEAATARAIRDGWLYTGDLGMIDDGELYVTGRAKELIIKRGSNYHPDDLERVAVEAGDGHVLRAAAFGCNDEAAGTERIVLLLETHGQTVHQRDELERAINGALVAAFGVAADVTRVVAPRTIERTTSGKLRRTALRERFLAGAWDEVRS